MQRSPVWKRILRTVIKYGIVGGVINIAYYLGMYWAGENPIGPSKNIADVFVMAVFLLFAIIEYSYLDAYHRFWKYMTVGIGSYLLVSVISSIFILVMLTSIAPELHQDYINERLQMMEQNKETFLEKFEAAHYEETYKAVQNTRPAQLALDDFLKKSMIGLFLSILISFALAIIKDQNKFKTQKSN